MRLRPAEYKRMSARQYKKAFGQKMASKSARGRVIWLNGAVLQRGRDYREMEPRSGIFMLVSRSKVSGTLAIGYYPEGGDPHVVEVLGEASPRGVYSVTSREPL